MKRCKLIFVKLKVRVKFYMNSSTEQIWFKMFYEHRKWQFELQGNRNFIFARRNAFMGLFWILKKGFKKIIFVVYSYKILIRGKNHAAIHSSKPWRWYIALASYRTVWTMFHVRRYKCFSSCANVVRTWFFIALFCCHHIAYAYGDFLWW